MKLKALILILVVFYCIRAVISPYKKKKKPIKFYAWPMALVIQVPPKSASNNNETADRLLFSFVNQMKATIFTKSYYSEDNWNKYSPYMALLKSSILMFIAVHNQLLNMSSRWQNCEYLTPIVHMVGNALVIQDLYAGITTDPGIQTYSKNEGKTNEFSNYLQKTLIPAANC